MIWRWWCLGQENFSSSPQKASSRGRRGNNKRWDTLMDRQMHAHLLFEPGRRLIRLFYSFMNISSTPVLCCVESFLFSIKFAYNTVLNWNWKFSTHTRVCVTKENWTRLNSTLNTKQHENFHMTTVGRVNSSRNGLKFSHLNEIVFFYAFFLLLLHTSSPLSWLDELFTILPTDTQSLKVF